MYEIQLTIKNLNITLLVEYLMNHIGIKRILLRFFSIIKWLFFSIKINLYFVNMHIKNENVMSQCSTQSLWIFTNSSHLQSNHWVPDRDNWLTISGARFRYFTVAVRCDWHVVKKRNYSILIDESSNASINIHCSPVDLPACGVKLNTWLK